MTVIASVIMKRPRFLDNLRGAYVTELYGKLSLVVGHGWTEGLLSK